MPDVVTYRLDDGIATITLNRPEHRNAIDLQVCAEMVDALRRFESDPLARVGVLSGAGKVFSAGADLKAFAGGDGPRIAGHEGGFGGFVRYPRTKPVVAAVNGHALAGGLELVLACELAVASRTALFGVPEVTIGLLAGGGGAVRLPAELPKKHAMRLLLTGKPVTADEALRMGLVNEVVEPDDVYSAALTLAGQIRDAAPRAVAATLELAEAIGSGMHAEQAWKLNDELLAELFESEDAAEGLRAFAAKRPPRWAAGS
jgi:enoyl-CoA hydratase/carnithine racemase